MKKNKGLFLSLTISFAFLFFITLTLKNAKDIKEIYNTVSIRFLDKGINRKTLDASLENEQKKGSLMIPEITVWSYEHKVELKNPVLGRKLECQAAKVNGNMLHVLPMELTNGNYPIPQDEYGCILDEHTAFELFGSTNIISNIIIYDKKEYYVRGVVKTNSQIFMIQSNGQNAEFKNLEFIYEDKDFAEKQTEEFIYQNGIAEKYLSIDGYVYGQVNWLFLTLPIWIWYMGCVLFFTHHFIKLNANTNIYRSIMSLLLPILTITVSFILMMSLFKGSLSIPLKFVPSKWSDFQHWTSVFSNFINQLKKIRYLVPNPKDVLIVDRIYALGYNTVLIGGGLVIITQSFLHLILSYKKQDK